MATTKRSLAVTFLIGATIALVGMTVGLSGGQDRSGALLDDKFLRTAYPLDEPRGYCLDISGTGPNARVDGQLQAHSCKYGRTTQDQQDQVFVSAPDGSGRILAQHYDRCLTVDAAESGAGLFVRPCSDSELQRWTYSWGRLSLVSRPDLCLTLAEETEPAGTDAWTSPINRASEISLQACDAAEPRQAWQQALPSERGLSVAATARAGMPEQVASEIAAMGNVVTRDAFTKSRALYETVSKVYGPDEVEVVKDLAYGPHDKHRLDIHTATRRRWPEPVPVVMFFHGGDLEADSKEAHVNVGDYFASLGLVGVNVTYRPVSEIAWPEAARDVGAAVTWVKENVAEYDGDPEKVFVIGAGAGATHVATYVFRPDLMPAGTEAPAGAALVSGSYSLDPANVPGSLMSYYGQDKGRWPEMAVAGRISRTDTPVLLTMAEFDPPEYQRSTITVVQELMLQHDAVPRFKQLLGHNHFSQQASIGTGDSMLTSGILDLIQTTTQQ